MKKIVFIFASMMIVEMQVIDAANSTPEEDSRRVERRLSTMENQIGIVGITLGLHTKQISSTYHKANNASKRVLELEQKMREVKKQQKEQDKLMASRQSASSEGAPLSSSDIDYLRIAFGILYKRAYAAEKKVQQQQVQIASLENYIKLLTNKKDDDSSESDEPSPPPRSYMILNFVEPGAEDTNTFPPY